MLLCFDTVLWSIIGDAGLFVSSVGPSDQAPPLVAHLDRKHGIAPGLQKEVAVGTVIQYQQRGSADRHQRWERIERAEQGERYGALKAQGMSQRQAAQVLDVPRSTLQAWRAYQERL